MDINMKQLSSILVKATDKKVRYRIEGVKEFTNDILTSYEVSKDEDVITISLKNDEIKTSDVTLISCTLYEERIDVWIYGDKTNRFNIYVPSHELVEII